MAWNKGCLSSSVRLPCMRLNLAYMMPRICLSAALFLWLPLVLFQKLLVGPIPVVLLKLQSAHIVTSSICQIKIEQSNLNNSCLVTLLRFRAVFRFPTSVGDEY
jgi:hypothetical protein